MVSGAAGGGAMTGIREKDTGTTAGARWFFPRTVHPALRIRC